MRISVSRLILGTIFIVQILLSSASYGKVLHVSKAGNGTDGLSWATAFVKVADALEIATEGDDIWVSQGVYEENITMVSGISLFGGFAGTETAEQFEERDWILYRTVLSATTEDHVIFTMQPCGIDGFTLTGAIALENALRIEGTKVHVRNCIIKGNPHIAVIVGDNAFCLMLNCTVSSNGGGFQGAIFCTDNSTLEKTDCVVSDTDGVGVGCIQGSTLICRNCRFDGNYNFVPFTPIHQQTNGGAVTIGTTSRPSHAEFHNCVFSNNSADRGQVVSIGHGSTARFSYCTIGNPDTKSSSSPLIQFPGGFPPQLEMENCIVWSATRSELFGGFDPPLSAGGAFVSHSCIQGGYEGEGNIDADPMFVTVPPRTLSGEGDLRLLANSPCIDAANTTGPETDIDGNPRPVDIPGLGREGEGAFDMGAYEFQLKKSDLNENGKVDAEDLFLFQAEWMEEGD